jgi:hypothetical protein
MGNQTEYFNRIGYKAKYQMGDRVFGHWNNIPFVGSIGNDSVIDDTGPRLSVHLDLPIRFEDSLKYAIIVRHKDVKPLILLT